MQEDVSMQLIVNNSLGEDIYVYVYPTNSNISIPAYVGELWKALAPECTKLAASTSTFRNRVEGINGGGTLVGQLQALIGAGVVLGTGYQCSKAAYEFVNRSQSMSVTVLAKSSLVINKDVLTPLISTDGVTAVLQSKSVNLTIRSGDQLINLYGVDQAGTIDVRPDGAVKSSSSTLYKWNGSQCIYQTPDNVCYVTSEKTFYIFKGDYFFKKTNADKCVSGPFLISDKFPGLRALPEFKNFYPRICYQSQSKTFWFFSDQVFYKLVDGQKSFSAPRKIADIFPGVNFQHNSFGDVTYVNDQKTLMIFDSDSYYTKVDNLLAKGPFEVKALTGTNFLTLFDSVTYEDDARQFWLFRNTDCWTKINGQEFRGPEPVARRFPCTSDSIVKQKAETGDL
jgi:hypothetical protein